MDFITRDDVEGFESFELLFETCGTPSTETVGVISRRSVSCKFLSGAFG